MSASPGIFRSRAPSASVLCVGIAALVFAAFSPAFSAGFLYWDDDKNFLENPAWRGLSFEHLRWMATTFRGGPYQPLSWLSLAIDQAVWGLRPAAFHVMNVALHAATAVAFFLLGRKLLALATPAMPSGRLDLAATAAALFFAAHPLRVESVAWITERRDVLSGLLYVLGFLAYLHAADTPRDPRRRLLFFASVSLFLLGLLAKASGMTLPLVLCALDRWLLRRRPREFLPEKLFFALPAAAFAVIAFLGQASVPRELRPLGEHGPFERVAQAAYAAVFYPAKTLLPVRLSPIYELPVPLDPLEPRFVAALGIAAAATALFFSVRRSLPGAWIAWASFLAIVAPVSGIVAAGPQLVADRYSYLACMPLALLGAGALFTGAGRRAPAISVVLVVVLAAATWRQARYWRDTETLFSRAVEVDPGSPIAHSVLARGLSMRGRNEDAARHYRRSIELAPDRPVPHNNLGLLLFQEGRIDEAIEEFRATLRVQDDYARGRTNLGGALLRRGDVAEAEAVLREAVRREPGDVGARANLGHALLARGRFEEAAREFETVLAANPRVPEAHEGLAQAYGKLGRPGPAGEHRRAAQALRGGSRAQ